ncbi:MAG: hypothetical protein ACFCU4_06765 [Puniceicoccaceae bacterium]
MTPVLVIFFNRSDKVARLMARLREVKPEILLLASDGPRPGVAGEAGKVAAIREMVDGMVNWSCTIHRFYQEINLGCGLGPATAITRTFELYEEAIILEDDCVPDPSFFPYCAELLERYRDDPRVMVISGQAFVGVPRRREADYFFTRYPYTWGWASWRRAWELFDLNLSDYQAILDEGWMEDVFEERQMRRVWRRRFEWVKDFRDPSVWDFQWFFACIFKGGLSVSPYENLVDYIGFGDGATHTNDAGRFPVCKPTGVRFPLRHPRLVVRDRLADRAIGRRYYAYNEFLFQVAAIGRRWMPRRFWAWLKRRFRFRAG